MKRFRIDERYITINLSRAITASVILTAYCLYLSADNYLHGAGTVGQVALLSGILTAVSAGIYYYCKRRNLQNSILLHAGILLQCCVYWGVYAFFLYTGGTGGTSIFLIFSAAPATLFFFNLLYGSGFLFVVFVGMVIYMNSPLRHTGYQFPDMYYTRLPAMYLGEVVVCAVAQYVAVKAEINKDRAIEEAVRANRSKSDFLANTSHEIRTPINAVLGMNEMILRESTVAESAGRMDEARIRESFQMIKRYAGSVESAGHNLLAIINDILDFSKIEEGRMDITEAEYRLSDVLNDVTNMIHFKAKEKDLFFVTDVDETLPDLLSGDAVRVRQVITNVLNNAVKYTETGGVTMKVRQTRDDAQAGSDGNGLPGTTLFIIIKDTGVGIRKEDQSRLFAKFERIDLERNSTIEGTGLGLVITKRLLEMMHGDVIVESEYGKGSTFTLMIPQQVVSEEAIGDFKTRFERNLGKRDAYREMFRAPDAHILVVDDTVMNLTVMEGLLKETQVQMDLVPGGLQALEKTKEKRYDLILMDYRMPQMDGAQTLQRIRVQEDGCNRDTAVICLTADAVQGARDRHLAEGFTDYLSKPVDVIMLEAVLMKHLPRDKVVRTMKAVAAEAEKEDSVLKNIYDSTGLLHLEEAMQYSTSENMLQKTLYVFYQTLPERIDEIGRYYEQGDYENYTIRVHAMKSAARLVGATEISELARKLEQMGNILSER